MEAQEPENLHFAEELARLKVAIVHYWLVTWRGGEKVLQSLLEIFPNADIYTLFYNKEVCSPYLKSRPVFTSILDFPFLRKRYQKLFPLYPLGVRSLRLREKYDLIISSESGPAKGVSNPEKIPHMCYIHTPMRYCWGQTELYLEALPKWTRPFARRRFDRLREWDRSTIDNVDLYIANSRNVAKRVRKYYQKDAEICHPPIDLDLFKNPLKENAREHYLSFGALTPAKNIGLLIDAFAELDRKLVVIGAGSEKAKLERKTGDNDNIEFKGELPLNEVIQYIQNARALLFPGEEDFGMVPLEVMSQGTPVIALAKGGALETVIENLKAPEKSTGLFFCEQTIESLLAAIDRFETIEDSFDQGWIRRHARKFGEDVFKQKFSRLTLNFISQR